MAGNLHPGAVTRPRGGFAVEFAAPHDDAGIRALLRDQPMGGLVRLSLEREPDSRLAAGIEGDAYHAVVAREKATGRVVGVGARSVREVWFNGRRVRMGYLSTLRRDPKVLGFRHLLRDGFDLLESARGEEELPFDLTSVIADNRAARRALERGLPGLPHYKPLCDWVTLILPTSSRRSNDPAIRTADATDLPAIASCLQAHGQRHQFAPVWSEQDLRCPARSRGLSVGDFSILSEHGEVRGCAALWDQRSFKQAVIRGYAPPLARWRPFVNVGLKLMGRPLLPPIGAALNMAYLSHTACNDDDPDTLARLIRAVLPRAAARGVDHLIVGVAGEGKTLPLLRRHFRPREYRAILYLVTHPSRTPGEWPDERPVHVEVATL